MQEFGYLVQGEAAGLPEATRADVLRSQRPKGGAGSVSLKKIVSR